MYTHKLNSKSYTFFTSGSKTEAGVGAAVIFNETKIMLKFPDTCSIFTAEAFAKSYALEIIKLNQINKAVIISDFL